MSSELGLKHFLTQEEMLQTQPIKWLDEKVLLVGEKDILEKKIFLTKLKTVFL